MAEGRMTNWLENKIIDLVFRGVEFTIPDNFYVGLYSTPISDEANAVEITGQGYARAMIPRSLTSWAGTQGAASVVPSNGDSGRTSNNVPIEFPMATGEWDVAMWFAIHDALTGGNMWFYGQLLYPRIVYPGDTPIVFNAGDLSVWIDV